MCECIIKTGIIGESYLSDIAIDDVKFIEVLSDCSKLRNEFSKKNSKEKKKEKYFSPISCHGRCGHNLTEKIAQAVKDVQSRHPDLRGPYRFHFPEDKKYQSITIPRSDYERLLEAASADDTIVWCEVCGAWLDHNEAAITDDFTGCWKAATHDAKYDKTCKSGRALE